MEKCCAVACACIWKIFMGSNFLDVVSCAPMTEEGMQFAAFLSYEPRTSDRKNMQRAVWCGKLRTSDRWLMSAIMPKLVAYFIITSCCCLAYSDTAKPWTPCYSRSNWYHVQRPSYKKSTPQLQKYWSSMRSTH